MLRDVARGHAILRGVRERLPTAILTCSLRRAFDDREENRELLFDLVEEAWQLGFAAVRVHGRTVEQKYAGKADWSILKELKQRYPTHTILGSGDVFTAQDAVRMKVETGVDVVWIARGAIGNPWIFRDAAKLLDAANAPVGATLASTGSTPSGNLESVDALGRGKPRPYGIRKSDV